MRSHVVQMTPEGEIVVPEEVREHLGIPGGESLEFLILDDGTVVVRSPIELLEAVFGAGAATGSQPLQVGLEPEIEEAMSLYDCEDFSTGFSC